MRNGWLILAAVLVVAAFTASASLADSRTYIMKAPGILADENAAAAEKAALSVKGVASAEAFVETHTIEVEVMDPSVSIGSVGKAINAAGYTVGKARLKGPDRK